MTVADPALLHGADVDLAAGGWAVVLVLVVAGICWTALRPVLHHSKETTVPCSAPDSLGDHPLEQADAGGVRSCSCGTVTALPAPVLAGRTDTREHRWPAVGPSTEPLAEVDVEEAATVERPLPHLVWPPR